MYWILHGKRSFSRDTDTEFTFSNALRLVTFTIRKFYFRIASVWPELRSLLQFALCLHFVAVLNKVLKK